MAQANDVPEMPLHALGLLKYLQIIGSTDNQVNLQEKFTKNKAQLAEALEILETLGLIEITVSLTDTDI